MESEFKKAIEQVCKERGRECVVDAEFNEAIRWDFLVKRGECLGK